MPRINQYTDNTTIENDDKMLTYDTQGAATKLTAFSTIWNWIVSKLHALTSSSAALTPSTDRVLMDKNGTMTRVEPAAVAKYGIETYNGSTIAGQAQTVKSALDSLNSKTQGTMTSAHTIDTANSCLWKYGKLCFITASVTLTSNVSSFGELFQLPSGFNPIMQTYICANKTDSSGSNRSLIFMDITAGSNKVRLITPCNSGDKINFTITYMTP